MKNFLYTISIIVCSAIVVGSAIAFAATSTTTTAIVEIISNGSSAGSANTETTSPVTAIDSTAVNTISVSSFGGGQLFANQNDAGQVLIPLRGYSTTMAGVITDPTGTLDLDSMQLSLYRSGVSDGIDCGENANDCYHVRDCTSEEGESENQREYSCTVAIEPWADATDRSGEYPDEHWVIAIAAPEKESGQLQVLAKTQRDMQSVLDVELPDTIDFGNLQRGTATDTDSNIEVDVYQDGNTETAFSVSGTDFECDEDGRIPVQRIQWSVNDIGYGEEGVTDLSTERVPVDFTLSYNKTGQEDGYGQKLYFNIAVPDVGAKGTCSGTIYILSEAD